MLLAERLAEPTSDVVTPINEGPKDLVQSVDFDSRELGWEDEATIYVLADPDQLDAETGDMFRRSLRVALGRLADEVTFPFDHLDLDRRGGWFVACLEDGVIRNPKNKYDVDGGANSEQRGFDSF